MGIVVCGLIKWKEITEGDDIKLVNTNACHPVSEIYYANWLTPVVGSTPP